MLVGSADILIVMFSRSQKDGTSRIQHVQTFRSQNRWNFKDSTCVCAFFGALSDMESSVGWFCRHVDSHVFVCVSSIELWEPSQRENVGDVPHQPFLLGRFVEDLDIEGPVATGGAAAHGVFFVEAYSFRPGQVQPDTGVDESCLINTAFPPPYHFQNLIRSFVACGPAELVGVV